MELVLRYRKRAAGVALRFSRRIPSRNPHCHKPRCLHRPLHLSERVRFRQHLQHPSFDSTAHRFSFIYPTNTQASTLHRQYQGHIELGRYGNIFVHMMTSAGREYFLPGLLVSSAENVDISHWQPHRKILMHYVIEAWRGHSIETVCNGVACFNAIKNGS